MESTYTHTHRVGRFGTLKNGIDRLNYYSVPSEEDMLLGSYIKISGYIGSGLQKNQYVRNIVVRITSFHTYLANMYCTYVCTYRRQKISRIFRLKIKIPRLDFFFRIAF